MGKDELKLGRLVQAVAVGLSRPGDDQRAVDVVVIRIRDRGPGMSP